MDQVDRYVLGLAVLEGDRDARKILADLLEEQGDRGLAQWARKCGPKDHQRLDFAIMLLPHRDALRLASDYAIEMASRYLAEWPMELIQYAATIIRQWLGNMVDDTIFEHEMPAKLEEMGRTDNHFFRHARRICDELLTASQHAIHAAHWRMLGDSRRAHYWESMTNQAVRRVMRLSVGGNLAIPGQTKLAIQAFRHLISPEGNRWPK